MTDNVFSSTETTESTNVFEGEGAGSEHTNQSVIEELVGEGKKFKTVDDLARGKMESDKFISTLQSELAELRTELGKQEYSKELLSQLQNKAQNSNSGNESVGKEAGNTNPANLSEKDVEALVAKHLKAEESKRTASENIQKASSALTKAFGEKTQEVLKAKTLELGLSMERMQEMAAESPTALLTLMGVNQTSNSNNSNLPKNQVNTTNFSNSTEERDFSYYQKLRRENKQKYFSPDVQRQMWKDMERLGPKFGA